MRLVRVKAPEGKGFEIAQVAFDLGVSQVALYQQPVLNRNRQRSMKDVVDIETATPIAKRSGCEYLQNRPTKLGNAWLNAF